MSLKDLAEKTDSTPGLISKIENARALPSLTKLLELALAMGVGPETLLEGVRSESTGHILIPKKGRRTLQKETAVGFEYQAILSQNLINCQMEIQHLRLMPGSKRKAISTEGEQFIYMLEGHIEFELSGKTLELSQGDALFFNGRHPHLPKNTSPNPATLLVLYFLLEA